MHSTLTFEEKYAAIIKKDSNFEGSFITGVKTTGIFCKPVCTARKPKKENVIFFDSAKEAILHGFRPCKVCKPMNNKAETPIEIQAIIKELTANPDLRLKDYDLRKRGLKPANIRRWFKKHHNMTFHSYQRMLRVNNAYTLLNKGVKVTDSAFQSGFESLSGFNERFHSIFGTSPTQSMDKNVINIIRFTTPLGPMFACATKSGICLLEFTNRRMLETEFKDLSKRLNAVILPGKNKFLDQVQEELKEYFEGLRKEFSVKLDLPGTPFQKSVWNVLLEIPYGNTRSYQKQAEILKNPKAIRAIASANGSNRVAIIIPCHRVIGKNGDLTGYAGGLPRKKWLLEHEARHSGNPPLFPFII